MISLVRIICLLSESILDLNIDYQSEEYQITNLGYPMAKKKRFRTIPNTYYKSANAIILVYDITSITSFKDIQQYWFNQIESYIYAGTQLVLIGNKCDLESQRAVSIDLAKQFSQKKNMIFFQVSAKTAKHVQESFSELSKILLYREDKSKKIEKQLVNNNQTNNHNVKKLNTTKINSEKKKGCF